MGGAEVRGIPTNSVYSLEFPVDTQLSEDNCISVLEKLRFTQCGCLKAFR